MRKRTYRHIEKIHKQFIERKDKFIGMAKQRFFSYIKIIQEDNEL